ncbi:MAG: ABC transporter substrate-binding protein [Gammaproteobacteria bacterium]|nr:ABC transporter substrate-binding protein [Gammaproteobacteria bacterium]
MRGRSITAALALMLATSAVLAVPPRAASLTLCADQYLLGLAAPEQIVAVSATATDPNQSLFAAEAARYPVHRGSSEELIALRAEVVLTDRWMPLQTAARLDRFGVRVISIPLPNSWEEIADTTRAIAAVLGRPEQGEARVAEMRTRLEHLAQWAVRRRAAPPLAAYFLPDGGSAGAGTFIDAVLQAAGTRNLATVLGLNGWGSFNLEQLAETQPDLVVLGFFDQGGDSRRMAFAHHPVFRRLLVERPVIAVPDRYWACSGWFLAEAATYIAEHLPTEPAP